MSWLRVLLFIFKDTAPTEIYTLSLHDALPILSAARRTRGDSPSALPSSRRQEDGRCAAGAWRHLAVGGQDRKSTRLNSSHRCISYAVFCLEKKTTVICHEAFRRALLQSRPPGS